MIKLKNEPDMARSPAGKLGFAHSGNFLTADDDFAAAGSIQARNQIEQCCLAGAAGAHQCQEFTFRNIERQIVQHIDLLAAAGKKLVYAANLDDGGIWSEFIRHGAAGTAMTNFENSNDE